MAAVLAALMITQGSFTASADEIGPGYDEQNKASTDTSVTDPANAWKKVNGVYQMPDGSAIQNVLARGIDVSRWQGEINWSQVAADDVSFVMLGTRSKGAVDPYFHRNIQQASAAGVKVGVYIYSLAVTVEMAEAEADFVLNLIHDYPVSYPVAFDMEDSTQGNLSKEELAAIANAFCKKISDSGYYPIIYANENWLKNKLDMSLMDYPVWVARYSARPSYQNPVMWQATSTGSVKGINGNVDIDFQFKDFSGQIRPIPGIPLTGNGIITATMPNRKTPGLRIVQTGIIWTAKALRPRAGSRYPAAVIIWTRPRERCRLAGVRIRENGTIWEAQELLKNGWIEDNGAWYYTDSNGIMQTGWLDADGKRYYMESSGKMAVGWTNQTANGTIWTHQVPWQRAGSRIMAPGIAQIQTA